jgi:hypothetical protein
MRRIAICVLLLVALVPSAAFASIAYLCSMDGNVRSACCCPTKKQRAHDESPTVKAACCCTVTVVTPTRHVAVDAPKAPVPVPPLIVSLVATDVLAPDRAPVAFITPRALPPPPLERSLYASHTALLL